MAALNGMEDFQREIHYHVLKREDGQIGLSATMSDRYHDVRVEVLVDYETLAVTSATVDFIRFPARDCPVVADRMKKLVGFTIGKGLTRKLLEVFGGGEGCGNLRVMLLGLLPLAMNVKAAAGFEDEQEMLDSIQEKLQGSCAGYSRPKTD